MAISEVGSAVAGGSGTAVSVTHGLSIAANDIVVVALHSDAASTQTDNNGAYPLTKPYGIGTPGDVSTTSVWVRVAGASEPAAYAFTLGATQNWSIVVRVFRGCDPSVIWDVTPAAARTATGTSITLTAPTMTITNAGAMGVCAFFADRTGVFSNITNSYGTEVMHGTALPGRLVSTFIRANLSAGATGTTSCDLSSSDDWAAYQFALKPAAAGGGIGKLAWWLNACKWHSPWEPRPSGLLVPKLATPTI